MNSGDSSRAARESNAELRVLVIARVGRDSELLCRAVESHGFLCAALSRPEDIFTQMKAGAGALIVTEESLNGSAENWTRSLQAQPPWSDLPVILLTPAGEASSAARSRALRNYGNITLLERPLRKESLLSTVETALRARRRQYEIRDYIRRQIESQEALRRTEKLAVAGRMAASIAHEINNPLAAVTNLLYLISTSKDVESVHKYNAIAQDELRRVSEIANQTLRFYRSPQSPELVDASEVVDSAAALFRSKLRTHGITLTRDYAPGLRLMVSVGELRQVLVNLIANAIDAMRNGGHLLLRTAARLNSATGQPGIRITIADDGEGVPSQASAHLFEPFFTTKGSTGTGLGLWLARDILERAGGHIRFRNHHAPHGAVFSLWLPLSPEPQAGGTQTLVGAGEKRRAV